MAYNKSEWWDHWICADCGLELSGSLGTSYMLHNELWLAVMGSPDGHLCILCFEARLGRPLIVRDFSRVPINEDIYWRLQWIREVGREQLLAESRQRRERLDRRAARRRELKTERRKQAEESLVKEEHHSSS